MPKDVIGKAVENTTDYVWDVYQKTPIMSTYTLAMAVFFNHTFVEKEMESRNISAGTYPTSNATSLLNTNIDYTEKLLPFFEDYFNISETLPKIDSLSVEKSMFAGMENWGLITYRKRNMAVLFVTAHEVAHSWTGNLVTCKNFTE